MGSAHCRRLALLSCGVVAAGLLASLVPPAAAVATRSCLIATSTSLDSQLPLAGGALLQRFSASAAGATKGAYDQSGKVLLTSYPREVYPTLINPRVGHRQVVEDLVLAQQPEALTAINGDFFPGVDIRYAQDVELSRGPMVRNGKVLRAVRAEQSVVGVDVTGRPYGGTLALSGKARPRLDGSRATPVVSVNWHQVLPGGVNVYTRDWSTAVRGDRAVVPRPRGSVEWVLDRRGTIEEIRSTTRRTRKLGSPVARGTTVLTFGRNVAGRASGVPRGTTVTVDVRQVTLTGTPLRTAVGRGLVLVRGGVAGPKGCRAYDVSKAARPRNIVGWDAEGAWRSITIPGAKFDGIGLRVGGFGLANAASLAQRLGLVEAYVLDGGGSTTLWTRGLDGVWSRRDLYGVNTTVCACQREVVNGLAFVAPS